MIFLSENNEYEDSSDNNNDSLLVDDDIIIFKRSEDDIIKDLKKFEYDMKDDSYDYLLKIHISKFTENQISKLDNEIKCIKSEIKVIERTSEKEMWIKELRELEKVF